jgi:hypothetical protein
LRRDFAAWYSSAVNLTLDELRADLIARWKAAFDRLPEV